ncbi:hypothetical protein Ahy_A02g009749 [Arachis hypogaea]|uniref:Aminotransferase-like plant mobile domain-containing protein n=1 Tax=Arachis hypogaea TaxID=3818 RepID=A0A445EI08_ARAHY|nr:hypothetical protein Ahy_A02g009749 [Arachis hypogaea]
MGDDPGRLYRLDGVAHIAGVINDEETFAECPDRTDEETIRRFARAYIMMLLGTQLFADKSGNRIHIRWLPYVARLEEMGRYSWGSAALAWLYRCMCRVANRHVVKLAGPLQLLQSWIFWRFPTLRPSGYDEISWPLASRWSGYNLGINNKGPRVQMARMKIDLLQPRQFIWMPYSALDVIQVVHPEVLEPRHTMLWRCRTSLIYFAVVEWHQVDRVLPQFGGVQPRPSPALNIDFLMSKDGRGGDRWFPTQYAEWHLHWQERAEHILQFDIVPDPGPSHDFLTWWYQHGKRFLSPEMLLGDPRGIPIPDEATQRGAGRLPDMDRVEDVPDRRRIERRARVGTRRSQREWNWVDRAMDDVDDPVRGGGRVRAIISDSTSSSSGSSNKPSPKPAGVGQCTSVGICSPYRTSSPTLSLRSTANEGDATGCIGGSYTGAEDEATAGLELEPATAAIVLAFRFEPPELDTTSTNFANNSGVLTSGNCIRQRNITCKSSSLPIVEQSNFTVS